MKRLWQIVLFLMVLWSPLPAFAEIDSGMLIGKWCLVSQTMNGYDFETLGMKNLSSKIKAKPGQEYHFTDENTVEVLMVDASTQTFPYKVIGKKNNLLLVRKWESFSLKSLTESEITATVYGTLKHRFTRGPCE